MEWVILMTNTGSRVIVVVMKVLSKSHASCKVINVS